MIMPVNQFVSCSQSRIEMSALVRDAECEPKSADVKEHILETRLKKQQDVFFYMSPADFKAGTGDIDVWIANLV